MNVTGEPHKRFYLRTLPGIDGQTEVVAEGIQFSTGALALHWHGAIIWTAVYKSLSDLVTSAGADYDVCWLDAPTAELAPGVEWTVCNLGDLADHGAAQCAGVGG